jgi:hypothetical protein
MTTRNQGKPNIGRIWAAILAGFLAASSLLATTVVGKGNGRERDRLIRLRIMDILVLNYGSTDWYAVTSSLAAHPEDPGNAAVMSVFLSIGNVHLNRFEKDGDLAHLDRALLFFEWVAANQSLWGDRLGSGSVVSYLDISVRRLQKECDVGDYGARIDALKNMAMAITAEEADTVVASKGTESTSPILGDASRVSLLAAAANFLKDDARAAVWGQEAAQMAADLKSSDCQSLDNAVALSLGALSYRLARQPIPEGFSDVTFYGVFRPSGCSSGIAYGYVTNSAISVVTPGASLDAAIHDGEMVAIYLEEYLWFYPPGSCFVIDDPGDNPIDKNR